MGPVCEQTARWQGARGEHTPDGAVNDEQRSQRAVCSKTRRAASLLAAAVVGSPLAALATAQMRSEKNSQRCNLAANTYFRDLWEGSVHLLARSREYLVCGMALVVLMRQDLFHESKLNACCAAICKGRQRNLFGSKS